MASAANEAPPRLVQASRTGLILGVLAGLWVAWADFGALWLWLPVWGDRASLLLRLPALIAPVGALLGALLGASFALSWRFAQARSTRPERWVGVPAVLLAALPLHLLALKLCSGGMMSRLSFRRPLEWALSLVLPGILWLVLWAATALGLRVRRQPALSRPIGFALLALSFAAGKLNQDFLPNLYDYLHGGLAIITWLLAGLGFLALSQSARFVGIVRRVQTRGVARATLASSLLLLVGSLFTLNANLNVRVAMFDARSPTSRSLLGAAQPLLSVIEARANTTRSKKGLFRGAIDTTGLPTQEGAHVVLITIDALRADHLGLYGYGRPVSPGLDALAKGATVFEHAYAQAPHSSYSLSSLQTSEYIHEVVALGHELPKATLANVFREHGYHTAAFFTDGIFHTEGQKLGLYRDGAFGFALFDHTNRESEDQTDRVLQEVDRIKGLGEPPSFLWVHYFDVHEPYEETRFGTGEMDRYDSEIAHVDREVTRLIKELDARFDREVVLAISADHGEEFREHGGVYHGSTLYEEQVHVPLIVRAASLPQRRFAQPVEVVDIAPTLLGIANVPTAKSMRGRDLRALATGRTTEPWPVFSAVLTKRMGVRYPIKLIADLRFGLFELYDLAHDPHERKNLAGSDATRLAEMRELVYAWLDSVERAPGAENSKNEGDGAWSQALGWGRLGDRRAVAPMSQLMLDQNAPTAMRVEAGQILAKLADTSCADTLVKALDTKPPEVAAEAAIALGRMFDDRARDALERLVHVEDPYVRARAAVSLGRLRDRAAVPALIDALWVAPTQYEREEAVRWLGRLRDRRAVEPLINIIPEFNLRYLVAVALGQIGDPRSYPALIDMLSWESRTNIRDEIVRGLGTLADERATEPLMHVLLSEPGLKQTSESLVRLSALEHGYLGGVDLAPQTRAVSGFERCEAGPLLHDWDYMNRTFCVSRGAEVKLKLPLPRSHANWTGGAQLIVRAKRSDSQEGAELALVLGNAAARTMHIDKDFAEQRFEVEASELRGDALNLTLRATPAEARFAVDHVLLLPKMASALAGSTSEPQPRDPTAAQSPAAAKPAQDAPHTP